jgi:hypothetical protein
MVTPLQSNIKASIARPMLLNSLPIRGSASIITIRVLNIVIEDDSLRFHVNIMTLYVRLRVEDVTYHIVALLWLLLILRGVGIEPEESEVAEQLKELPTPDHLVLLL